MIAFLKGTLERNLAQQLIVDVNGVGYAVNVPSGAFDAFQVGAQVKVLTHLYVRENIHMLFGFATADQRDLFLLLIERVSGVGPKLAMSVIGGMSVENFRACVVAGDLVALSKVKGVGKKTAERVILELKDKVGVADAWQAVADAGATAGGRASSEALLALISLGYKQVDAQKAVAAAVKVAGNDELSADGLIRAALKQLN